MSRSWTVTRLDGQLTLLGLQLDLVEQGIVQLELPVDGQGMLRRHQHVLASHCLRVQVGRLHGWHLAVVIAPLPRRIPSIGTQGNAENSSHRFAVVLIDLERRKM